MKCGVIIHGLIPPSRDKVRKANECKKEAVSILRVSEEMSVYLCEGCVGHVTLRRVGEKESNGSAGT